MTATTMQQLLDKYLDDTITMEELALLREAVLSGTEAALQEVIIEKVLRENRYRETFSGDKSLEFEAVMAAAGERSAGRRPVKWLQRPLFRYSAAAVLLLLMGAGAYLLQRRHWQEKRIAAQEAQETTPSGNQAMLVLADGTSVPLDSAGKGMLAQQGGVKIVKQRNGELAYEGPAANGQTLAFNILLTPRGKTFRVTLPDGSRVWLNAASALKYPIALNAGLRTVELTGEAYFEVSATPHAQPFRVKAGDAEVTVLGTHFNVNAYKDDGALHVTLLEGAVNVRAKDGPARLAPGQQANVGPSGNIQLRQADTAQVMAWKNGFFEFRNAKLDAVLSQLARWYDISARYEGNSGRKGFTGKIPRTYSLEEVLAVLQAGGLHCRLEGKELVVLP